MARREKNGDRGGFLPFDVLDGVEAVFYAVAGFVVLGFLLIRGFVAAHAMGGSPALGAVGVAGLIVVVMAARDALERRWSPVSKALAATYLACVLAVVVADLITR